MLFQIQSLALLKTTFIFAPTIVGVTGVFRNPPYARIAKPLHRNIVGLSGPTYAAGVSVNISIDIKFRH